MHWRLRILNWKEISKKEYLKYKISKAGEKDGGNRDSQSTTTNEGKSLERLGYIMLNEKKDGLKDTEETDMKSAIERVPSPIRVTPHGVLRGTLTPRAERTVNRADNVKGVH